MPFFEITREIELFSDFETYTGHVAYVDNEKQAIEFCRKHKDCNYGEIFITKYDNYLEAQLNTVSCCENCYYFDNETNYCASWEETIPNCICEDYIRRDD